MLTKFNQLGLTNLFGHSWLVIFGSFSSGHFMSEIFWSFLRRILGGVREDVTEEQAKNVFSETCGKIKKVFNKKEWNMTERFRIQRRKFKDGTVLQAVFYEPLNKEDAQEIYTLFNKYKS